MNKIEYQPGNKVVLNPFVYISPSMQTISLFVFVMLIPQIVMLFLTKSYSSIAIIISAVLASLAAEGIFNFVKKTFSFSWFITVIQGIMIGFFLPAGYSPVAVFFITIVSMIVCKYAFGGFSYSWINVMALTVAVCYFLSSVNFPGSAITINDLQSKNASLALIQNGYIPLYEKDDLITSFLNRTIFKAVGIRIPNGYVTLFWDTGAVIPAFRFNFMTLVSSIILFSFEMIDMLIPVTFLIVYGLLIRFVPSFVFGVQVIYGDLFLAMLTSGILFSSLFVLQWYGTVPSTVLGKIIYGIGAGIACYLIVGYGTSSVGCMFMILVMNLFSLAIGLLELRQIKINVKKYLMPRVRSLREGE